MGPLALMGRAFVAPLGPLWAGPLWAGPFWAPMGQALVGRALVGWALMDRALMGAGPHGLGPCGPPGPLCAGPYGSPWARMGRSLTRGVLVAPLGAQGWIEFHKLY